MSSYPYASEQSGAVDPGAWLARLALRPQLSLIMFFVAVVQQSLGHHNADNSWLFTVCEQMLAGAKPYVDIIETNPPASFLVYMPAAMLAHALRLSIELTVSACVFAAAAGSIVLAGRILIACGLLKGAQAAVLGNAAVFALILMPGFSFAEREHIAAIAILPMLAVYAATANGGSVKTPHALVAGALAGLVMMIKPHFALAVALPLMTVMWRRWSLGPALQIANIVAACVVLAYIAVVVALFPAFFDVLPSLLYAYVPVVAPLSEVMLESWFVTTVVLLIAVYAAMRGRAFDLRVAMCAAASIGFTGAYLAQSKGWVNHGLPGAALAFLALSTAMAPALEELARGQVDGLWLRSRRIVMFILAPAILGMPILFGTLIQFGMSEEYTGLTAAVRRSGPAHPRIMALSGELDVGHPLVRRVDGVWVGQSHSLWLMLSAQLLIDSKRGDRQMLAEYVERDARTFAANVRDNKPDIILVGAGERVLQMSANPHIAAAMATYAPGETASGVTIWMRKPL